MPRFRNLEGAGRDAPGGTRGQDGTDGTPARAQRAARRSRLLRKRLMRVAQLGPS
ncbi:hypothetical protein EDF28_2206 [Curtobacterium sp. PhB137]|nr:hypothetical protein EDF28_2206 [Curtobacterium sp. PhB137]